MKITKAVFSLFLLAFFACAPYKFYSGLNLPREKVALIKYGRPSAKIGQIRIESINDTPVQGTPSKIVVLPGPISMAVSCVYGQGISAWSSEANCVLNWDAQAGETYEINGTVDFKVKKWTAWIKRLKNQAVLDQCVIIQDNSTPASEKPLPIPLKYR